MRSKRAHRRSIKPNTLKHVRLRIAVHHRHHRRYAGIKGGPHPHVVRPRKPGVKRASTHRSALHAHRAHRRGYHIHRRPGYHVHRQKGYHLKHKRRHLHATHRRKGYHLHKHRHLAHKIHRRKGLHHPHKGSHAKRKFHHRKGGWHGKRHVGWGAHRHKWSHQNPPAITPASYINQF